MTEHRDPHRAKLEELESVIDDLLDAGMSPELLLEHVAIHVAQWEPIR